MEFVDAWRGGEKCLGICEERVNARVAKKVLCLNYEYPPIGGGAGRVTRVLSELLSRMGYKICVLTSGFRSMVGVSEEYGCRVVRLRTLRKHPGYSNTLEKISYVLSAILYTHKVIQEFKPDFVHAHFAIPSGIVAYYIKKRYSIPYMISSHGGDLPGFTPETRVYFRLFNSVFRVVWRNASEAVVLNSELAEVVRKHYRIHAHVIPNGVFTQKGDIGFDVDPGNVKLLFVGRLNRQKNVEFLIRALSEAKFRNWTLFIAGDGPLREKLEKMVRDSGLSGRVVFRGWLGDSELRDYYRSCDILCLPSVNEGIPMVGLEAMAGGMALLVSDNGGNRELVDDAKNGFVFKQGDCEDFLLKLGEMVSDPVRLEEMKRYSIKKVKDFDWENIARMYSEVYEKFRS